VEEDRANKQASYSRDNRQLLFPEIMNVEPSYRLGV
jgi:hypothetical protein